MKKPLAGKCSAGGDWCSPAKAGVASVRQHNAARMLHLQNFDKALRVFIGVSFRVTTPM
jgi:hypothetical protein